MLVDQSKGKTLTGQQPSLKIQTGPVPIPRDARLFLLFLSEINLVIGALFYVYPDISISLWAWMVKREREGVNQGFRAKFSTILLRIPDTNRWVFRTNNAANA